jgi:hypothetical protein
MTKNFDITEIAKVRSLEIAKSLEVGYQVLISFCMVGWDRSSLFFPGEGTWAEVEEIESCGMPCSASRTLPKTCKSCKGYIKFKGYKSLCYGNQDKFPFVKVRSNKLKKLFDEVLGDI